MASGGNRWQNFFEESKSPHNTPHNKLFKKYGHYSTVLRCSEALRTD